MTLRKKVSSLPKTDWQAIQLQKGYKASVKAGTITIGPRPTPERNKALEKVWADLQTKPPIGYSDPNQWVYAKADVRPSSFPFCPRAYVMERLGMKAEDDFKVLNNHYTEVGKAIHYVVQNAWGRSNLWGLWMCARPSCPDRQKNRPRSTIPGFYPEETECKACGSKKWEYEELTIYDPKIGLRGHVDGVLLYEDWASILEVKTVGDEKLAKLKKTSKADMAKMFFAMSPWYGYWHQASTYATLVQKRYRNLPPIKQVDFFIQSRDNPKNFVVFTVPVPQDHSWYGEIRSRVLMAKEALEYGCIPRGYGSTKEELDDLPTCTWCKFKDGCLKPEEHIEFEIDALHDDEVHSELVTIQKQEKKKWVESYEET